MEILFLVIIGLLAGVLAGFFGIGGGIIIVPALMLLLGYGQHKANGTSLVALLAPVGLLGVIKYFAAGKIQVHEMKAGLIIACGIFFGTYVGSSLAVATTQEALRKSFSILLILVALKLWFSKT